MELELKIFFTILWCSIATEGSNFTILCITNDGGACMDLNVSYQHPPLRLSQLQKYLNEQAKNKVVTTIYLSAGEHNLTETLSPPTRILDFSIIGTKDDAPSSVMCSGLGGIYFEKKEYRSKSSITLTDLILNNCYTKRGEKLATKYPAAIILVAIKNYYFTNVTIRNSPHSGIFSERCYRQVLDSCIFENNAVSDIKIRFTTHHRINSSISISNTYFKGVSKFSSLDIEVQNLVNTTSNLYNCTFSNKSPSHLQFIALDAVDPTWKHAMKIEHSAFMGYGNYGIFFKTKNNDNNIEVSVSESIFWNYSMCAIFLLNVLMATISNCTINSSRTGIHAVSNSSKHEFHGELNISGSSLTNNSNAITIVLPHHNSILQDCTIRFSNVTNTNKRNKAAIYIQGSHQVAKETVSVDNVHIENNHGAGFNCSAIYARNIGLRMSNSFIRSNNCTGIFLSGSTLSISGTIHITGNSGILGGGLRLAQERIQNSNSSTTWANPVIKLQEHSSLVLLNNTASVYGGGIYIENQCYDDNMCFFMLINKKSQAELPYKIKLTGNRAADGGDAIFGGCLQHCCLDDTDEINITDANNIFWTITDILDEIRTSKSASPFAEQPQKVAFCSNTSAAVIYGTTCEDNHSISAYRGQIFQLELMIVDNTCFATTGIIQAKASGVTSELSTEALNSCDIYKSADRYCKKYSYSLSAPSNVKKLTLNFYMQGQRTPTQLNVEFLNCPLGFSLNGAKCVCTDALAKAGIKCHSSNCTFIVPAMTWLGEVNHSLAVHMFCRRCRTSGKQSVQISDVNANSKPLGTSKGNKFDSLCQPNRTGVLCGECTVNTSLKLGGYSCGFCPESGYKGIWMILAFALSGLILGILLLRLNFTVSTGLINGLIFYSNVVYSNSDDYLRISQDTNSAQLNNVVRFLYTFQAWVNLDLGTSTCFFPGYNQYIATWMQFVFPFYLWLIIVVIIILSKFSIRLSKFTGNNTISALATLFLLSYTKLLATTIAASSYTKLRPLNCSDEDLVWIEDSSIAYLKGKHIPLFIASILLLIFYLLPFSLLLIFGPLFQSYSHFKILSYVNKIKPFLDSFYGPYTDTFRFWPGLLLLTRIILLNLFAYYSLGDRYFKLTAIIALTVLLFSALWLLEKTKHTTVYRHKVPNYLEMFFLINLLLYSTLTLYFSQQDPTVIYKQQIATCIFVGSAFLVLCGILFYHVANFAILQGFPIKKIKEKHFKTIPASSSWINSLKRSDPKELSDGISVSEDGKTYTSMELREPLIQS